MMLFCHKIQPILEKPSFIGAEDAAGWSDRFELVISFSITQLCVERSVQIRARAQAEKGGTLLLRVRQNPASFTAKDKVELMKGNRSEMPCDWYWAHCQPDSTGRSGMMTDELERWQSAWRDG